MFAATKMLLATPTVSGPTLVPFTDTFARADTGNGLLNNGWLQDPTTSSTVYTFTISGGMAFGGGDSPVAWRNTGVVNQSVTVDITHLNDGDVLLIGTNSDVIGSIAAGSTGAYYLGGTWYFIDQNGDLTLSQFKGAPPPLASFSSLVAAGLNRVTAGRYGDTAWVIATDSNGINPSILMDWDTGYPISTGTYAQFGLTSSNPPTDGLDSITLAATTSAPADPWTVFDGGDAANPGFDIYDGGTAASIPTDILDGG